MKNCDNCKANKVCDHNKFGFENCDNHIPLNNTSQNEEGAECPSCHGTGRIGTTDWLTRGMTKQQIDEEKAEAVKEFHEELRLTAVNDTIKKAKMMFCSGETYTCDEIRYTLDFLENEIKKKAAEV
jgi:hypothetical protein